MNKENNFNTRIFYLNEINYRELCLNHIQFALENKTSYKNLMINYLDYDSKALICNEIKSLGLNNISNQLINTYYNN